MSDSNKPKPLPPDDFGATTPNIKIPKSDSSGFSEPPSNDWEKTNYNYSPKDLGRDEWNKTAYNIPKANPPQPSAKDGEWGMTQANINLPSQQQNQYEQPFEEDFGEKRQNFDKTSVGINLPKNEPPKYQAPPSEEKEEETTAERKKGGIPGWIWASAGLLGMFLFTVVVLLAVYFIFLGKTGFEVAIKGVPLRSDVRVNDSYWGVTSVDGTIRLQSLKAGEVKKIEIKNPSWNCLPVEISLEEAQDGKFIQKPVSCSETGKVESNPNQNPPNADCLKPTNYDIARQCAYTELDKLEKAGNWTVEQLLFAMNLYRINFDVDSAVIRGEDLKFIDRAAGFMKKLPPTTSIEVGGHTDSDGSDEHNMGLSEKRATSVRNALVAKGIISTMLVTKPYGESQPINTDPTATGKFQNRRIEYKKLN